jgi:hypothetical protein
MAHPDTSHISFAYPPAASMWVVTLYYLLFNRIHTYPVTLLLIGPGYFRAKPSPVWIPQAVLKCCYSTPTRLRRWNRQCFQKSRHIKFTRRGITRKKTYNSVCSLRKFRIFTTVPCVVWNCVLWNSNGCFGGTFYCHTSWSKHSNNGSLSFWKKMKLVSPLHIETSVTWICFSHGLPMFLSVAEKLTSFFL